MGASRNFVRASSHCLSKNGLNGNFHGVTEATIVAWLKFANTSDTGAFIVSLPEDSGAGSLGMDIRQNGANLAGDIVCSVDLTAADTAIAIPNTTAWHFCSLRLKTNGWGTADCRLQLNDTVSDFAFQTTGGQTLKASADELNIGRFGTFGSHWSGNAAHVHGFTRSLSDPELEQLRWYPGTIPDAVFWIPCMGGSPEPDLSGNANDCTVTGATESSDGPPVSMGRRYWRVGAVVGAPPATRQQTLMLLGVGA
jgi:hypothetical protein